MAARINFAPFAPTLRRIAAPVARRSGKAWLLAFGAMASLIMLTGCGESTSTATAASSSTIAPALKLALGTLDLEGTDQSVDAAAAAQLLPLWQLLDQLDTSGAAAPAEITAVIEQIESTMTASQLNAISAMKLTDTDVAKAAQGSGSSAVTGTNTVDSNAQAASVAGAMLGGDMGPAGMPLDGGGPMPAASSQQNSSASASSGAANTPSLIKQVIQLLESKLQS